jgi:hypothetical protein
VSPKEVKKEIKKLVYEKPVLIGLGDTLNLGMGAKPCNDGSHLAGSCTTGSYAGQDCVPGYTPTGVCNPGGGK